MKRAFFRLAVLPLSVILAASSARAVMTRDEARDLLWSTIEDKPPFTIDNWGDAFDAAKALDLADVILFLDQLKSGYADFTDRDPYVEHVLNALFSRLIDHWDQVAEKYLTLIPPVAVARTMCVHGKLGGPGNLFRAYYRAETKFARANLFRAIHAAFRRLPLPKLDDDQYVVFVERWYWQNRLRLDPDRDFMTVNPPPDQPPEGFVGIGAFFCPEDLLQNEEAKP